MEPGTGEAPTAPPAGGGSGSLYLTALRAVFWIFCAGVVSFAAVRVWPLAAAALHILTPFILGLVFAYVLHPIVLFVQHRLRLGRGMGILVVALLLVAVITGFLAVLLPVVFSQAREVVNAVIKFFNEGDIVNKVFTNLPEEDRAEVRQLINDALGQVRDAFESLLRGETEMLKPVAAGSLQAASQTVHVAFAAFGWLGAVVATTTITTISTAWYLVEMSKIPGVIRRLIPPAADRPRIWEVMVKANASVGGFLRGQLIACIGVGILTTILMLLVGPKKYAVLIGFTAGSVNFIPYLGPTVGATPALLWAMFAPGFEDMGARLVQVAMIATGFGLIQAIDGFVFQPFIVGPQAALHPLAVMLSLVVGAQFGVGGMILAVPVASALKVVFVEFYWRHTADFMPDEAASPAGSASPPSVPGGGGP